MISDNIESSASRPKLPLRISSKNCFWKATKASATKFKTLVDDFFDFKEFGGSVGTINEVDLVIYTGSTIVANSIFAYLPLASASAGATSSSDTRTVYFASASTTPGFNGIYTGSGGGQATFGSFIHADSNLRTNVDEGFYNPRGPGGGILSGSVSSSVFKFSFVGNNISSNANLRRSGSYFVTRVMQKMQ